MQADLGSVVGADTDQSEARRIGHSPEHILATYVKVSTITVHEAIHSPYSLQRVLLIVRHVL